ncbi:phosphotransferase [Clostridium sp. C8-1-8]|uniref:phosphotransferase enzyme family protein n=1 Tax=Clostridium sp. C8-1-8 TaxID=2698831 RepID=UPI001369290D|nr:phosphotransferase [Clostridium sp. C8-1-8]
MVSLDQPINEILEKAENLYNAKTVNRELLGNSANMVFELSTEDASLIVRISEYSEHKEKHISFELNWVKYLSSKILEVVAPILNTNGNLYEVVNINKNSYIICAFEKAKGKLVNINNPHKWNDKLFYKLGEIMGDIHKISKDYALNKDYRPEFQWNEDFAFSPEFNLINDSEALQVWNNITSQLEKLPRTIDCYGIIHNDLHHLNFFLHDNRIKVFDFDDCVCSWYPIDIVITLFQVISTISYKETELRNTFGKQFASAFLRGYKTKQVLESFWLDKFDLFLKYRRICSYKFFNALFSNNPSTSHVEYLSWLRNEIISDKPFIEINFEELYRNL